MLCSFFFFFFFFQAEDGIRDVAVTGVQTCALPISWAFLSEWKIARKLRPRRVSSLRSSSTVENRRLQGTAPCRPGCVPFVWPDTSRCPHVRLTCRLSWFLDDRRRPH